MYQGMTNLNNKIYTNNNNLLLGIVNDLREIINNIHDNILIKRIGDIINKMNFIINDNKKNTQLIINHISSLKDSINKKFDQLNINNNNINNNQLNYQTISYKNGERYVGQIINGLKEGKGSFYFISGDRYEGDFRNNKREGKGIYYYNNGNRYEGDFRNDKKEGKGVFYFNNGDREMGDYYNDQPIGKHAILTKNGDVVPYYH